MTGKELKYNNYLPILWLLSTAFTYLHLPVNIPSSIQLPEIVFLFWLLFDFRALLDQKKIISFITLAWPILLLGIYMLINSFLLTKEVNALYDSLVLFYLITVSFLLFSRGNFIRKTPNLWFYSLLALVFLNGIPAIIGFVLSQFNIPNSLAFSKSSPYPIVGAFGRPLGFHYTPTMLFNNLVLPFLGLIFLKNPPEKKLKSIGLGITITVILLTLNKHIFTLIISVIFVLYFTRQLTLKMSLFIGIGLLLFQQFNIYFTTIPSSQEPQELQTNLGGVPDCADSPIVSIGKWNLYPTYYYAMRTNQIPLLQKHWLTGIGPGQYIRHQEKINRENPDQPCFRSIISEPHSMWVGTLLENGILAFLLLIIFFYQSLQRIRNIPDSNFQSRFIVGMIIFILLAGLVTDILNFRPFWFVIGILYALSGNKNINS